MRLDLYVVVGIGNERLGFHVAVAVGKIQEPIARKFERPSGVTLVRRTHSFATGLFARTLTVKSGTHDIEGRLERCRVKAQAARIIRRLVTPPGRRVAGGCGPPVRKPYRQVRSVPEQHLRARHPIEAIAIQK